MPSTSLRQTVLSQARHVVVKIGSQLLTNHAGDLDTRYMRAIGNQVARLMERRYSVTIVSSGSIAVGRKTLAMAQRPTDIGVLQAVAAIGQSGLMDRWHAIFKKHHLHVAQMLLNRDDFNDRQRYLNIRNCITEMHQLNAVPIINENDTVNVEEIRLGDNDILSALVANALSADALVLLSVVDGLLDADGKVIDLVDDPLEVHRHVTGTTSGMGTGGMGTKLEAARLVTEAGEIAVIANGRRKDVLLRLLDGEKLGTVFVPARKKLPLRRRWIGQTVRPAGVIVVDEGAVRAITQDHKSLLAVGITEIVGKFDKGDIVVVRDRCGHEIARGLINFTDQESRLIMGRHTSQFETLLGQRAYDEVIHRDNLVVTTKTTWPLNP